MGGKAWSAITKWEPEIEVALARAQEQALRDGDYRRDREKDGPSFRSIADVRKQYEIDGSASVIDIVTLGAAPAPDVAGPFPDDALIDIFGTKFPDKSSVVARVSSLFEMLSRAECAYVVLYEDQRPTEIIFLGYSAD